MSYSIREGKYLNTTEIEVLLLHLSIFNVPEHQVPEDLWLGDRSMVSQWAKGGQPDSGLKRPNADIGNRQ